MTQLCFPFLYEGYDSHTPRCAMCGHELLKPDPTSSFCDSCQRAYRDAQKWRPRKGAEK